MVQTVNLKYKIGEFKKKGEIMNTKRVTKKDLCLIPNRVVRIDGEEDDWKVWKVEGEYCSCRKLYANIGKKGKKIHFSKLFFVPNKP